MLKIIQSAAVVFLLSQQAQAIDTTAKQAILMDFQTGVVLFEKNADELMSPSSMTKIMTAFMVFDLLEKKKLKLEDTFPISQNAWKKGGSRMYVELGSRVSVHDLLQGIITQSGNDASIAVAEGIAGNEAVFAAEMTEVVRNWGDKVTKFKNATGWPDEEHLTTARQLAKISFELIARFPNEYKKYFAQKEFKYNNINQINRNPLIHKDIGADGIKTGQTDLGGAGLVGSAVQKGRRLILVVNGLKGKVDRAQESEKLMQWGFRTTMTPKIFAKGAEVVKANVWLGQKAVVPLVIKDDLFITIQRADAKKLKVEIHYPEPIAAPISVGQELGKITVTMPDETVIERVLVAGESVDAGGFFERIGAAFNYLLFGSAEDKK